MIRPAAALCLLLAGCASAPPRDVYVAWATPCSNGAQVYRVRFVDTQAPTLACIRRAIDTGQDAYAAQTAVLTLLGFPTVACAVSWYGTGYAEIYAPISPSATQIAVVAATLHWPDAILTHELEHVFGDDHGTCRYDR